ncbi:MAG TPA: 4-alpha-glucanotransferase [Thermoleophilia bacterium]|nr:4-alpha-glucanotransferase [Thermoleophilia bacterium]
MSSPLQELAQSYGIFTEYTDGLGDPHHPDDDTLLAVLRSLGVRIDYPDQAAEVLRERRAEQVATIVEPVVVAWDGRLTGLPIRRPRAAATSPVAVSVSTEDGGEIEFARTYRRDDAEVRILPEDGGACRFVVPVDVSIPLGYHTLDIGVGPYRQTALLVSAPRRCPSVEHPSWGVFLPLYALRHTRDWGIGDLGGLAQMQHWLAGLHGDYVATLPIFASFLAESGPFEPSPYLPVSRLFWNEAFLDVEGLAEARAASVRHLLEAQPIIFEREALQRRSHVDYRRVAGLKRQVIAECAAAVADSPEREAAFRMWLAEDPTRGAYARFRASCERHGSPEAGGRASCHAAPNVDPGAVRYHAYAQWAMDQQLAALPRRGAARVAFDLPLGVHPDGFDVWQRPETFATGVHLGAPPDAFMTEGQDWSAPPLHPLASRASGHRYLVSCLRTIMGRCGLVRLDHVMGLHRQFFVPPDRGPRSGTYVRFPAEELYALVSLEAQRSGTIVVGEDLGTVPQEVRRTMAEHGVLGTYALQAVEIDDAADGSRLPSRDSLATLSTHDMPTFATFWRDGDLESRQSLEPASARWITAERRRRDALRQYLQRATHGGGATPEPATASLRDRLLACLSLLAESPADIVIADLEDLWLETRPQNVPGSRDQSTNWRRRARFPLEAFDTAAIVAVLAAVDRRRRGAAA